MNNRIVWVPVYAGFSIVQSDGGRFVNDLPKRKCEQSDPLIFFFFSGLGDYDVFARQYRGMGEGDLDCVSFRFALLQAIEDCNVLLLNTAGQNKLCVEYLGVGCDNFHFENFDFIKINRDIYWLRGEATCSPSLS